MSYPLSPVNTPEEMNSIRLDIILQTPGKEEHIAGTIAECKETDGMLDEMVSLMLEASS